MSEVLLMESGLMSGASSKMRSTVSSLLKLLRKVGLGYIAGEAARTI